MSISADPNKENPDFHENKLQIDLITEENRQLKEELDILKKQFQDTINFVPNMTEFYNENSELKHRNSELKNINDDLTKRLKIAMQTNEDLKNEKIKSKSEVSRVYVDEVAELQTKLSSILSENEKNTARFQEQIKNLELINHNFQSEVSSLQSQISKILKLSGGYFTTIFKTSDELIEYLKQGSSQNSNSTNESQNMNLTQDDNEEIIQILKNKLQKEKQKRNELNLNFLKLTKKLEHDKLLSEEQIQQLNDHIRQQANEIKRLELLNQQKQIPEISNNQPTIYKNNNNNKSKLRNASCQVSLVEIAENSEIGDLKRQLLNANSKLSDQQNDYAAIKMKYDDLRKQMGDIESSKAQIADKLKWTNEQLSECQSNLILQKKELETLELVNHELKEKLNQKEAENVLPQTELESKMKFFEVEYNNSQKALSNLEKLFTNQKKEISDLTINKEKLILIIEKQNILLNGMNEIINSKRFGGKQNRTFLYTDSNNNNGNADEDLFNGDNNKASEKVITVEPKFKWAIGQLPDDINDIVKEFAENDSLSIESRIKNIFFVLNKWIEQKDISSQKEILNISNEKEETEKKFEKFKSDVISACETDNDTIAECSSANDDNKNISESNVPAFIRNVISQRIDYHRELLQLKDQYKRLLEMEKFDNLESLIEDNRKTKEANIKIIEKLEQEHRKRLAMKKQFKEYVTLKEKDYSEKMELNRKSKENSRKLIERLQDTINKLQVQNKSLIDQIKEIPELRKKQHEEDEKNQKIAIIEDDDSYIQNNIKDDNLKEVVSNSKIGFENEELKIQVNSLNKSVQTWKEAAKEAHDENALLQQKIEKLQEDYESKINQISKKSESQKDQHNETVQSLSDKLKKLTEEHKNQIEKLNEKLVESHQKYDKVVTELSHLQFEKERISHSNDLKIEAIERSRKLSEAQLKAQMMSIDSKYAIIIEEERQKSEKSKRELIEYFISAFRTFSNVDQQLNEEAFRDVVRKVKSQLDKSDRMEMSIRKLIKANEDEPIEDALTQFIIKYHPQFQAK